MKHVAAGAIMPTKEQTAKEKDEKDINRELKETKAARDRDACGKTLFGS
jgi:hypothetical protein